jgi:hypothetical protein
MLGAHGNLCLAISWSLKVFLFVDKCRNEGGALPDHKRNVGCQWQPMLGQQVAIENIFVCRCDRLVKVRFTQKVLVKCEIDIQKTQKLHLNFYFQ